MLSRLIRNNLLSRESEPPSTRRVFVNQIFEIQANHSLPLDKAELLDLLAEDIVIPFHKHVCPQCHNIPHSKVSRLVWSVCCSLLHPLLQDWLEAAVKPGMAVLHRGKRVKPFHHWEPIYIGTNEEPLYDERLSWEGRSDKMAQVSTAH